MKKISMVSLVALLAATPMMAKASNVTLVPETNDKVAEETNVASTSYVKGAYNVLGKAVNSKQDQLKAGTDNVATAVKTATGTNAVTAFSSSAVTNASDSSLVSEKAIMKVMEDARATSINSNVNSASEYKFATEKAVSSAISNAAGNASYTNASMSGITTISGAIDNLDSRVDDLESNTSFSAAEQAAHSDYITSEKDLASNVMNIVTAVEKLNGDANTEGSVAKAEADAKAYTNTKGVRVFTAWGSTTSEVVALDTLPAQP